MKKTEIIMPADVERLVYSLFVDDLHAKRVQSLSDAALGVIQAASLGVHAIGRGLATAKGLSDKHAVKQVDRFLSNINIDVWVLFGSWVPYILNGLSEVYINLDWSDFDADKQTMLVASIQTHHGRSIPLLWMTVFKNTLKGNTNEYEFKLLRRLKEIVDPKCKITIVADRGFADSETFNVIQNELSFDYLIRFKAGISVTDNKDITKSANDWIGDSGRMRVLHDTTFTSKKYPVKTAIFVCRKGMKEAWCLASSAQHKTGHKLIKHYGKRFTIEEMFRDIKDIRFGMGMSWNPIGKPERRDRMFLLAALAQTLLTILGQAGEDTGLDRVLKTNTVKTRTISLMRQGVLWYERIPNMPIVRLKILMTRFGELLLQDKFYSSIFCRE